MPVLVNGETIDDALVRGEARAIKERLRIELPNDDDLSIELRAREWARENEIERVLLQQAAKAEFGNENPAALENLLAKVTANVPRPSFKEVADAYRRSKDSFYMPEVVRAAHIVKNVDETATEKEAKDAIEQIALDLQNGANFAELADSRSDCPGQGGDLSYFARGRMVEEFEEVVFALQVGQISPAFRSPFGFHIARLVERRAPGIRPLAEVRKELEEKLWAERKQQRLEGFIDKLRSKAEIRKVAARSEAAL